MSKDGLRIDQVNVSLTGIRVTRGPGGFAPHSAERLEGTLRLSFSDITAALARPEILDQLLVGVAGIAKPEITLVNGKDGGVKIVGSVEAFGRRIPIRASTRVRVENNLLLVSATHLEGLPLLRAIPLQLLDVVLPLKLPAGLAFTDVTTETGCFVLSFEGVDVPLSGLPASEEPHVVIEDETD
ncbi:MAG: DUF2993 domain-containing protein [Jatrophihabitantaceae bacterium]